MTRGWQWPWIVVGLLTANALAVLLLIVAASGDPSHAVEPDYYAKGLAWDAEQAKARAAERLGWRLALAVVPARHAGHRRVEIRLVDRAGRPLDGARLRLEARQLARASEVLRSALTAGDGASYVATLPLRRRGLWELRVVVDHRGRRLTRSFLRELDTLEPAAPAAGTGLSRAGGER